MDRTKRIQQAVSVLSVGASVVAAQQAATWLSAHQQQLPGWLSPVTAVVVYTIGSLVLRFLLELLLESFQPLRRLLLGNQFIEGIWFEIISQNNIPVGIGHSEIIFSDGKFRFGGEDFMLNGSDKGHFRADLIELSWPVLKYKYTYETGEHKDSGYGEAQFLERGDGPPLKYAGAFVNLRDGSRYMFESFRIEDRELLERFHADLGKQGTVHQYLEGLVNERVAKAGVTQFVTGNRGVQPDARR